MKSVKKEKTNQYVYDISLDGTVICANGNIVASNTDGFNFKMPDTYRYTEENPYIGKGLNRNTVVGDKYIGVEGDVAEFNDLFMRGKMGLGIDEYADSTINFSRKNYADNLGNGKTKKVGNTIKSKKMPVYIEKFIDKGIDLLLYSKGKEFLTEYYSYFDKIYNANIPLRDIASKGKIKISIDEYKKKCNEVTKAGTKKSRQAWYELVIKEGIKVDVGDTIYYINTGAKKSDSDVKRITHYFQNINGVKTNVTKEVNSKWNLYKKQLKLYEKGETDKLTNEFKELVNKKIHLMGESGVGVQYNLINYVEKILNRNLDKSEKIYTEDEILLNCKLLPNEIVEADDDTFCDDETEYNVEKYLEQFNKRIKPLTVCFSNEIRDKILITNPDNKPYFTDEESKLVSGQPFKVTDQDTYAQLMTMDKKEIDFWTRIGEIPPFVEECKINWDKVVEEFNEEKAKENDEKFKILDEKYLNIINNLTEDEINEFFESGELNEKLNKLVYIDWEKNDLKFYFKDLPGITPSTGGSIVDDFYKEKELTDDIF